MSLLALTWDINPELFSIGTYSVRYYSILWLVAFAAAFFILRNFYIKEGLKVSALETLTIYVFAGAFIGARLVHCIFYDGAYFLTHPLEIIIPFTEDADGNWIMTGYTGLASHGGILGMTIAFLIYCKIYKVDPWDIADKMVVIGSLGGVLIRVGNFFNSEMIGKPTDLPWAVIFKEVDNIPRHPSQLYEAITYIIVFAIVYYLYTRKREMHAPGFIAGIAISLGFVARFFIEYTKVSQSEFEDSLMLNMGQILSIPFIVIAAWVIYLKRKPLTDI